jgi:hypothetical protein
LTVTGAVATNAIRTVAGYASSIRAALSALFAGFDAFTVFAKSGALITIRVILALADASGITAGIGRARGYALHTYPAAVADLTDDRTVDASGIAARDTCLSRLATRSRTVAVAVS